MITFGFKNKFSGWIRAVIAILIGLLMVIRPGTSLIIVVKIIAAILIATGIVTLVYGIINRRSGGMGLLVFNTVVDIVIGALLFAFPEFVASFVIIVIGAVLLGFGVSQIVVMISAASMVLITPWTFILPVICAGGGLLLLLRPFEGAATMTLLAGIAILVYGLSELFTTWKMARAMKEYEIRFPSSSGSSDGGKKGTDYSGVKDAEFEKVDE